MQQGSAVNFSLKPAHRQSDLISYPRKAFSQGLPRC
jgi:hypothetical protein